MKNFLVQQGLIVTEDYTLGQRQLDRYFYKIQI